MIAPHEPTKDPRITWEASFAAKKFDVLLLGMKTKDTPEIEKRDGYEIRRKQVDYDKSGRFFFFFSTLCLTSPLNTLLLALVYAITFPILLIAKYVFKTLKFLSKRAPKILTLKSNLLKQLKGDYFDLLWYINFVSELTQSFLQEIKNLPQKPDIIHCNDILSLMVGLIAKRNYKCKVIYDAHEYWPYSDPKAGPTQRFMFKLYESFLIRKADHVITVNPAIANLIAKAYKLNKVFSVPNATPWLETQKQAAPGELTKLANGRVKFIFQGGFARCRGIEELLTAWIEVDPTKAALFFRGPPGPNREEYVQLAQELGILDRSAYFLSSVSEDNLIEAASEADVGLIPYMPSLINHIYSCPNKLSQYLHAGLMVISNNLVYVKQILEESKTGITYDSHKTLLNTIRIAIDDVKLRDTCKSNALNYSKNHFNWQKVYPTLEDLYDSNKSSATLRQS